MSPCLHSCQSDFSIITNTAIISSLIETSLPKGQCTLVFKGSPKNMVPAHLFAYQEKKITQILYTESIRQGLISQAEGESEQYIVL